MSIEKFSCDSRVKWRTACSSDTSGSTRALLATEFLRHLRGGGMRVLPGGAAAGAGMREDQRFLHGRVTHFITSVIAAT